MDKQKTTRDFNAVEIKLASPERIREWSFGEVTKPETINYRTQKNERGGLFDERIFGPERDYECHCGKYKKIRYKGIVCEKCGVELTRSIVRRERMGHIELASPVAHIWFLRGVPSRIGLLLGLPVSELEKVVYFAGYILTNVFENEKMRVIKEIESEYKTKLHTLKDEEEQEKLKKLFTEAKKEVLAIEKGKVIDVTTYHRYSLKYSAVFEAGIGAEAIYDIFKGLNMEELEVKLKESLEKAGLAERPKLLKRLALARAMIKSKVRPEWMFLTIIPIIPPALRPMVALEGGRHATSDVNDLYRRVINRNNRLKKLQEIGAPDVILRNEKRILQESVDSLLDNSIRHGQTTAKSQAQKRVLKSLADALKGKQGLFRQHLLGKRVDYSGRSVIVVGPNLKFDQCGLPKKMALELFRPFVISKILEAELAFNIRGAGKLIDEKIPEVWAILERVTKDKFVLLNRAPTLHRLGIQGFKPILIEGNAIQVHPLVCTAFNADFDGDQMAVYLPLSEKAQSEAKNLLASSHNLLGPRNGNIITNPKIDIVLGIYWMTKMIAGEKGEGKIFTTPNSAITAYDFGAVSFRAKIKVLPTDSLKYQLFEKQVFETTVGRLLFNSVLPKDFLYVNKELNFKEISKLVDELVNKYGLKDMPQILDKLKSFGYTYVTKSGITWGIDEAQVPKDKHIVIAEAQNEADKIVEQYNDGFLTVDEKYRKTIEVWEKTTGQIEKLIPGTFTDNSSLADMLASGARGSLSSVVQMAGMKGLIINTKGRTIDFPIISSNIEGLTPIEYFIATYGSRKGLVDTALNTARAGYLTRRLVDVAQSVIVNEDDCGENMGRQIVPTDDIVGSEISLAKYISGRTITKNIVDSKGNILFKKGHLLTKDDAEQTDKAGVKEVFVRTPLTCKASSGICRKCYGFDLGRRKLVELGEAVGIVAAQAIGEPGTQLTMRTFHAGGVAAVGGDITMGLPRVEEIFERRIPKSPAIISHTDGEVIAIEATGKEKKITVLPDIGKSVSKKNGQINYSTSIRRMLLVKIGDKVKKGQFLTDGSANMAEMLKYTGEKATQEYIISEVLKIYELQGASISPKHLEIIVHQMFSRVQIKDVGNTSFVANQIVSSADLAKANDSIEIENGVPAKAEQLVCGISEISLTTDSWLSAASFQHTTRILIDAAIVGKVDNLCNLKENVIIGNLIPAGTGFKPRNKKSPKVNEEEKK
ncbi:DNA-directed RNA polymerase subunit beta' [Patescibacteria group bacterium]|nr:DNA-directed RNA polymerase subunit beta' [Patescibacteria group bacterium]